MIQKTHRVSTHTINHSLRDQSSDDTKYFLAFVKIFPFLHHFTCCNPALSYYTTLMVARANFKWKSVQSFSPPITFTDQDTITHYMSCLFHYRAASLNLLWKTIAIFHNKNWLDSFSNLQFINITASMDRFINLTEKTINNCAALKSVIYSTALGNSDTINRWISTRSAQHLILKPWW